MDEEDKAQSDWTVVENEVVVAEYLAMFQMQLSGLEFVKLHRIQALQDIIRRSRPSIEFKLRNIRFNRHAAIYSTYAGQGNN